MSKTIILSLICISCYAADVCAGTEAQRQRDIKKMQDAQLKEAQKVKPGPSDSRIVILNDGTLMKVKNGPRR